MSLPEQLLARADQSAARLGVNRSPLYAMALQEFLDGQGVDPVTARLDALADSQGRGSGAASARHLIDAGTWEE